jgi:hypothetical protein
MGQPTNSSNPGGPYQARPDLGPGIGFGAGLPGPEFQEGSGMGPVTGLPYGSQPGADIQGNQPAANMLPPGGMGGGKSGGPVGGMLPGIIGGQMPGMGGQLVGGAYGRPILGGGTQPPAQNNGPYFDDYYMQQTNGGVNLNGDVQSYIDRYKAQYPNAVFEDPNMLAQTAPDFSNNDSMTMAITDPRQIAYENNYGNGPTPPTPAPSPFQNQQQPITQGTGQLPPGFGALSPIDRSQIGNAQIGMTNRFAPPNAPGVRRAQPLPAPARVPAARVSNANVNTPARVAKPITRTRVKPR